MADEQGRPQTEHELTRLLAQTLVAREVMEPMEKIGWAFGTPPPPGQADNPPAPGGAPQPVPASTPVATTAAAEGAPAQANVPTAPTEIDWEALKDPKSGLYAGKYQTKEEAARGIGHAVNMAKDVMTQNALLQQELDRVRGELTSRQTQPGASPAPAPSSAPSAPVSRPDVDAALANFGAVLSDVAENGGVLDEDAAKRLERSLREATVAAARGAAEDALNSRERAKNEDDAAWNAVDDFMTKNHPDASKFADEIGLFVQTNPLIDKAIKALVASGDRVAAAEFAWVEYDKARGTAGVQATLAAATNTEIRMEAADQVRKEAVDAARKDAGVISSSAGGVHEATQTAPSQSEIEAAAAGMRAYGAQPGNPAAAAWRRMVIPLDPKVFGN